MSELVAENEAESQAATRANAIFVARMMGYFAKRYGSEMEMGPAVLWAILQEHNAVQLGQDFGEIRDHVDELLDAVEYVGSSTGSDSIRLAQAFLILARIVAGRMDSRSVREGLSSAIELLDGATLTYRGADRVAPRGWIDPEPGKVRHA